MHRKRRPTYGQLEAAHILLRFDSSDPNSNKPRIDSLYKLLVAGADFDGLATKYSQDRQTAQRGGYIGFFGIQQLEKPFEEAAFSLKNDGDFSEPFRTSVGWHIVKRISHKGIQPYNIEKSRLETKISQDPRFAKAKAEMLARLKKEDNLREQKDVLDNFVGSLTDTFLTFKWKAPEMKSEKTLFSLGKDYKVTLGDFTDYLGRASRERLRMGRGGDVSAAAHTLYNSFVDEQIMKFEEGRLEEKYPEFKSLMREYEEGILLFEATKLLVWDKASQDSSGLAEFYKQIEGKYRWEERAVTSIYKLDDRYKDRLDEVRGFAATHSPEEVMEKFNDTDPPMLRHESKTMEYSVYPEFKGMEWKAGTLSQSEPDPKSHHVKFVKIEEILPAGLKTLDEARGYIVADYQDYLESQWVEKLRQEYEVKVNQKAFDSLVQ